MAEGFWLGKIWKILMLVFRLCQISLVVHGALIPFTASVRSYAVDAWPE